MIGDDDKRWYVRHAELIYKLILVALVGMWIAFPPHASQPSAAKPQGTLMIGQAR